MTLAVALIARLGSAGAALSGYVGRSGGVARGRRSVPGRRRAGRRGARGEWRLGPAHAAVLFVMLLVCWAAAAAAPAAASSSAASPAAIIPRLTAADEKRAVDLALADRAVAQMLSGGQYRIAAVKPWQNGVSRDVMGASVFLAPATPGSFAARVPFVAHTGGDSPWPPLEIEQHQVRASDVTQLAVQIDLRGDRVVEVFPDHGKLLENTGSPFAYIPWFTRNAWLALPIFVVLGLVIASRARRRPRRGWGSADAVARGPFEHLVVTVLLLATLGWYGYSVWAEVLHTPHGLTRVPSALSLTWLFIVVPLLLFLGALRLEYARTSRRRAWRLLLVLAFVVAAGALFLVRTVTNLTLGTYLLAMCAALVAVRHLATPRALGQRFVTDFRFLSH